MKFIRRLLTSAIWVLRRILTSIINELNKLLKKIEKNQEWIKSQELEADEILLFPLDKYPHIKQRKITINNETRNALMTSVPMTFKCKLKILKSDLLEFGIGILKDSQFNSMCGFLFKVFLQDEKGKNIPIFSKLLFPNLYQEDSEWRDAKLELSEYVGENQTIIFKTKIIGLITKQNYVKAVWSNPKIHREDKRKKGENIDIILIILDALRPDHLGCYDYHRNTSPNIDNFAKDSILFENAVSQAFWTLPSITSILTSLYPSTHNTYMIGNLQKSKIILPDVLRNHNYTCFGYISALLAPKYGFARGFDYYFYKGYDYWAKRSNAEEITMKAMNFLTENKYKKKFILLHYFDLHIPYIAPNNYNSKFDTIYTGIINGRITNFKLFLNKPKSHIQKRDLEQTFALYDNEIAYLDYYIGILINHLKFLGIYENSLIIITSDHGEEHWEHNKIGHCTLYDQVIKIPLFIKLPSWVDQKDKKIRELVEGSINIFPTILDFLGITLPNNLQGKSLLPLINDKKDSSQISYKEAYSEHMYPWLKDKYGISIRTMNYKYIYTTHFNIADFTQFQKKDEIKELYYLKDDPAESNNLTHIQEDLVKKFQKKIDIFINNTLKYHQNKEREKLTNKIRELIDLRKI